MAKDKVNFEELPIEVQMRHVFGNYKRQVQEGILYDILTEFYFADWTRKCDYDKMTSEEVVEAVVAVCKKIEEKYNYSLDAEFRAQSYFEDKDWNEDFI